MHAVAGDEPLTDPIDADDDDRDLVRAQPPAKRAKPCVPRVCVSMLRFLGVLLFDLRQHALVGPLFRACAADAC